MKKGFTLIELLAVIVILAIIALIATPIILGIIKNAKEESNERSVDLYVKAAELAVARENLKGEFKPTTCEVTGGECNCNGTKLNVEVENGTGINGTITFNEKGVIISNTLVVGTSTEEESQSQESEEEPQVPEPVEEPPAPILDPFERDDWATIAANVRSGSYSYEVGDTKAIYMGTFGTHTVRIANTTPCDGTLTSETACGFVLEFVEEITDHNMNSSDTTEGGWPASEMRTYVNNDIYNALPEELRNIIIDTTVVSNSINNGNIISTDKIYLLSDVEVGGYSIRTWPGVTRILDYYESITTTDISACKGWLEPWWLRDVYDETSFRNIPYCAGDRYFETSASRVEGVSPAFRIG